MENYTIAYSLTDVVDKNPNERYKSLQLSNLTTQDMESSIRELLQKNSDLMSQLHKALAKISRLRRQRSALLDVIVKVNKYDTEDDFDDNLSAGDLESDIESADELESNNKRGAYKREESEEYMPNANAPKRRKVGESKRNQRGQRHVEVPRDENGNYIFPARFGNTTLVALGEIIPNENFFNQNYIFPVGFTTQRSYRSMVDVDRPTTYTCSIKRGEHDKPLFCIQAEDAPDIVIEKPTASAAWSEVLKRANMLRKNGFKNTVSGPEYFGLTFKTIKLMIQELPGARDCIGYQWLDA